MNQLLKDRIEDLDEEIYEIKESLKEFHTSSHRELLHNIWFILEDDDRDPEERGMFVDEAHIFGIIPKTRKAEKYLKELDQKGFILEKCGLRKIHRTDNGISEEVEESCKRYSRTLLNFETLEDVSEIIKVGSEYSRKTAIYLTDEGCSIKLQNKHFLAAITPSVPISTDEIDVDDFDEAFEDLILCEGGNGDE